MIELQTKLFGSTFLATESPIPNFVIPNLSQFEVAIILTTEQNSDSSMAGNAAIIYRDAQNRAYLGEMITLSFNEPQVISVPPLADIYEIHFSPNSWVLDLKIEVW